MKVKYNIQVIATITFYVTIIFHRYIFHTYGDDMILQVVFYTALFFSATLLEEVHRKSIKALKGLVILDFLFRILTIIIHFIYLFFTTNIMITNTLTIMFLLFSLILQFMIYQKSIKPLIKQEESNCLVRKQDLNVFLKKYFEDKIEVNRIELKKELNEIIKLLRLSGKGNIVGIVLLLIPFTSNLIYKYAPALIMTNIMIVSFLLYLFFKYYMELINRMYSNVAAKNKAIIIESFFFILGYTVLFLSETVFYEEIGIMQVSIWSFFGLSIYPILYRKSELKERLRVIYIKCRLE